MSDNYEICGQCWSQRYHPNSSLTLDQSNSLSDNVMVPDPGPGNRPGCDSSHFFWWVALLKGQGSAGSDRPLVLRPCSKPSISNSMMLLAEATGSVLTADFNTSMLTSEHCLKLPFPYTGWRHCNLRVAKDEYHSISRNFGHNSRWNQEDRSVQHPLLVDLPCLLSHPIFRRFADSLRRVLHGFLVPPESWTRNGGPVLLQCHGSTSSLTYE